MFTHNVIAWGSRAGYDSEEEADAAARSFVRAHACRAAVEVDSTETVLRTYQPGDGGEPVEVTCCRYHAGGGRAAVPCLIASPKELRGACGQRGAK